MERFWSKVNKTKTCWLWTACVLESGYGGFRFNGVCEGSHRVSWKLTYGPIPKGKCVLHHCDVRLCVNPKHFFLGTLADNVRDAQAKGRIPRNENHWNSKLTKQDVRFIRKNHHKIRQNILAKKFHVKQSTICKISNDRGRLYV